MTKYTDIKEWFYSLIEKDEQFFNYYDIPQNEALEIAHERADRYLEEAVRVIQTECMPQVDFSKRTEASDGFDFEFTQTELLLISMIMYERYLFRDFSYLKTYNVNFTSSEIKVFDPSNARTSFMEMYNSVKEENARLKDIYKNTDRLTGAYRTFDVSLYDVEDVRI